MSQNDTWTVVNQSAQNQIRFYHQIVGKNYILVGGEPAITITLKPTETANVPAEIQGITNRPLINKPSIVTDTRLAI